MADHGEIVRDEEEGEAEALLQADEEVDDLGADVDVEGGDRLVGDDQLRFDRESARGADALALSAGELMRVALGRSRRKSDHVQELGHAGLRLGRAVDQLMEAERLGQDLAHGHARIQ